MTDTLTTNRGLTKVGIGESDNTWGQKLNLNADILDLALGGTLTKSTTSGTITLNSDEHGYARIRLNGALVGNLIVAFDGVRGGVWIVDNDTTNDFSVTAKVAGQTGVVIPAGSNRLVFFNGTDIEELGTPSIDPQVAAIAALVPAANQAMYWTSVSALALADTTSYGRSLWNLADAAALRTIAGLVIGTNVQAYDTDLAAIALLTTTAFGRSALELADAAAMRTLADAQRLGVLKTPVTKTDNYTLALTDIATFIRMSAASQKDFTIPANATVAFPIGSWINLASIGSTAARVKGAVGVTLNGVSAGTGTFSAAYRGAMLHKVDTDTWEIYGGIGTVA